MKATQVCSVPDCDALIGRHGAHGMCGKHYQRAHRGQDMNAPSNYDDSLVRFWRSIKQTAGCWLWTGQTDRKGYGVHAVAPTTWPAHRFSYQLHNGPIPDGLWVLHHCDNPPCVNPAHLYAGTPADNVRDKVDRSRCASMPGEQNPFAKLTEPEIVSIREAYAIGDITQRALAKRFNISQTHVRRIIGKKAWSHVEPLES